MEKVSAHDETRLLKDFWSRRWASFDRVYQSTGLLHLSTRAALRLREEAALEVMGAYAAPTVLDLGCGTGRQLLAAAWRGASRLEGIDLSEAAVLRGRETLSSSPYAGRVQLRSGDALTAPVEGTFDVVWALGVFDYLRDPLPLLARMVALSHGHVALSIRRAWALRVPLRKLTYWAAGCPIYVYTAGEVEGLLHRVGLTEIEVKTISPGLYFAAGRSRTQARRAPC